MVSDNEFQIPVIKFSTDSKDLDRGTEGWHNLCKRVREACENYGCFELVYDKMPIQSRAETFSGIRQLFDLPLDIKKKNVSPKPNSGYLGQIAAVPLYESFGIDDAFNYDSLKSFSELMWPNDHDLFLPAVTVMLKSLDGLNHLIGTMILDGFGLGEKMESIMKCEPLLRLMKYQAPPSGEYMNGLVPHTDMGSYTLLCDDQVPGLEIETKDGQWIRLSPSPNSFIFFVGDLLMAWSNGRMRSARHRVMMSGDKDRYSLAIFGAPVDGSIIKAPKELIDEEHPQVFKEFDYLDFVKFRNSEEGRATDSEMQMFVFAGI
ncbi:hypothetical protein F2P56_026128 [Juglans regia]|uniref:2-oxoglutarate-dependent dioxygenase DAO n=2 Tax=Juglans regia TaxID=51240 RepID=A0A833U456_JUGRE|nr:probable 2-oxoglutarate-dependent dioxygenase AOP1 [Juglans regia]KAF5456677.1 hypothetical protein F2P56_026128 [Juglans regia]